ncbi:MAG: hypothetical protein ABSA11_09535 [Candidatus Bathyarchaeia archaeon]|jgi:hypothetical protein
MKAYYREGYHFRIKTVKGKPYLSARKGKEENGLGFLTPELRDFIEKLKRPQEKQNGSEIDESRRQMSKYIVRLHPTQTYPTQELTEFSREEIESAIFDIRFERARVKTIDCYYSLNGYCQYWKYMPNSHLLKKLYERFAGGEHVLSAYSDISLAGRPDRELVRVTELICFDCNKYFPRNKRRKTSDVCTSFTHAKCLG